MSRDPRSREPRGREKDTDAVSDELPLDRTTGAPRMVPDPAALHEPFPQTDIQQAYYVGRSEDYSLGNNGIHGWIEVACTGLDHDRLERAWNRTTDRHPMLRSITLPDQSQRILPHQEYRMERLDLRDLSDDERAATLDALRAEQSHHKYDPAMWPLFRILLARVSDDTTVLVASFDGQNIDLWSLQKVFDDWVDAYEDPALEWPAPTVTYRDYAVALTALKETPEYARSLAYWRERMTDLPAAPAIPLARPVESVTKPTYARCATVIPEEEWSGIRELARRHEVTVSTLLLAAYAEVLGVWSGDARFTVNVTLSNRLPLHPDIDTVVGNFSSMVLLGVDRSTGTFQDRARAVQRQLWNDFDHHTASGVPAIRELARLRGTPDGLLFPFVYTYVVGTSAYRALGRLGEIRDVVTMTPQVALDQQVMEQDGALHVSWDYVEQLFPAGLVQDMFAAYRRMLGLLRSERHWRASSFPLVPREQLAERSAVNATARPVPDELPHTMFEQRAADHPDREAVVWPSGSLSYRALDHAANRIARRLRELGARPDHPVPVLLAKGHRQIVAVYAALKAGAAYAPIDTAAPAARISHLLDRLDSPVVLTEHAMDDAIAWPDGLVRLYLDDLVDPADEGTGTGDQELLEPVQSGDDLAYVLHTSGSTGRPKGVMIETRGVVNRITDLAERFRIGPGDRVFGVTALHHDMSVLDILVTLSVAGATLVLPEADQAKEPAAWARLIAEHGVTLWNSVPAFMEMLVLHTEQAGDPGSLMSLRTVLMGGDFIPVTLPDRIKALAPHTEVHSVGGPTETTIMDISHRVDAVDPGRRTIPYGKPMANRSYQVFDEQLNPCPVWVPGELCIAGEGLARGYWKDEEQTARAFVVHPRSGVRYYRSGDYGRYLPGGDLEIMGRRDLQVKIRGQRIELEEVRAALADHPDVSSAVVTTSTDGEHLGASRLHAYVVLKNAAQLGAVEAFGPADEVILDPFERLAFKLRHPGVRQDLAELPGLALEAPELLPGVPERRSVRHYLSDPVTVDHLGRLLAALGSRTTDDSPFPRYRYPSGGNLYPVQTYVYLAPGRVKGADPGVYYYQPDTHRLVPLTPDADIPPSVHAAMNRAAFEASAFSVYLVARRSAVDPLYGAMADELCYVEAGAISQLLMTTAAEAGLGLCPIGGLDFDAIRGHFALLDTDQLVHSLVGGIPDPAGEAPPSDSAQDITERLHTALAERLPAHMLPDTVTVLERMPLTANGKVDRAALPVPDSEAPAAADNGPLTRTEELIATAWQEVLGRTPGREENFFRAGGDSLRATRLAVRLGQLLGKEVSVRTLFEHPTVAGLGRAVGDAAEARPLPLAPVERAERPQLSRPQQRLWYIDQVAEDEGAYNNPMAFRLRGALDRDALIRAVEEIVRRHETLRTSFPAVDGRPHQKVTPAGTGLIATVDLREHPDPDAEALRLVTEDVGRGFSVADGPLLRGRLLRTGDEDHLLAMDIHHIVCDYWSFGVFARELAALYGAFAQGDPSPLPELPVQYADFADWQRRWLDDGLLDDQLAHWDGKLAGELPVVQLPADRPRLAVQRFRGARVSFDLDQELATGLRKFAESEQATLFMTLLSAFAVLLGRHTGLTDIPVGAPVAGRPHPDLEGLIGLFANSVVLRCDLDDNPPVSELIGRIRTMTLDAFQNQNAPFESVVSRLGTHRDLSHNPLFQVMFSLENSMPGIELGGLDIEPLPVEPGTEHFDLTMFWNEDGEDVRATIRYNTDLFDESTVLRLWSHYTTLLRAMLADPTVRIGDLPIADEAELGLVAAWSTGTEEAPAATAVPQLLAAQAARTPDRTALVCPGTGTTLSYAELDAATEQLA
ncbi:amino acid adenylation domain-containing protein, partial [Streptomyces sp. W16]|uniref:non-ribosomal peptide synthetase n=1 Tax=Streptomyces sp. W16 TaxID=3076631 RepID=UPI00295C3861